MIVTLVEMTKSAATIVTSNIQYSIMVRGYSKIALNNDGTEMCLTMIENYDKMKLGETGS